MSDRTELLRRVADSLLPIELEGWHFGDSVGFEGLVSASAALGDSRHAAFAHGFVRGWDARRTGFVPLDCTAPGATICALHTATGDGRLRDVARELAEYLVQRRKVRGVYRTWDESPLRRPYGPTALTEEGLELLAAPGPGVFIDCLHFDPPFFAALAATTGESRWREEAVAQARGYVELLQDQESGLFHHFWLERTSRPYVLGWGRGQGWALLGLLDVVEHLPPGPDRDHLAQAASRLVDAMVRAQRPDGHWDALVPAPTATPETSTAAFMAVGFRRALRSRVTDRADVRDAADAAHAAVVAALTPEGVLDGVSAAVWASTEPEHYRHVPTGFVVPWGQGPVALMLAEGDRP